MEDSMSDADAIANIIEAIRVELEESEGPDDVVLEYSDAVKLLAEIDRLRAELAAARAEPQRPAAIVQVIGGHFHGFGSDTDALAFRNERDDVGISQHSVCYSWTWHARAAEGEAK
jgi:hypothetical protein